jgi:uncharacterized protein (DUF433 family)
MTAERVVDEEERMRRVPGIIFVDGVTGRRARVAGTGLEVFEVIQVYRSCGQDWDRLKAGLHWLTDAQLRAALKYFELYPEDILPHIDEERARRRVEELEAKRRRLYPDR